MPNQTKAAFLRELAKRYGPIRRLGNSYSLYAVCEGVARVYIRYSKLHSRNETFYGLREEDIRELEGHPSVICFLWDGQAEPLLVPFSEFEDLFRSFSPARDGQYKAQVYPKNDGTELYVANAGRFNIESYFGWQELDGLLDSARLGPMPELSHSHIQTLLGAIGVAKSYDVWIPPNDRGRLEWSIANHFECRETLPYGFESVADILQEIDVLWIERGSNKVGALFEVEHSTPIYSGLLRFNDIHLAAPNLRPRFSIVANDIRRINFARQISRPTFKTSGLAELCTFFEYANVFGWYSRIKTRSN